MSLLDNLEEEAQNMMADPAKRAKIEQIAKDEGISMQAATSHFMKHDDSA